MRSQPSASFTSDIRLREVTDDDLPVFFEHQRDPEANRMAAFPARDRDAFLAHWAKIRGDEAVTIRAILLDGQVVGSIVSWERERKQVIGYWIGRTYWGRGIATRALSAFLGLVKVRPPYAYVAKHNTRSIRVLEKCGFTMCREETESLDPPSDGVEEYVFKLGIYEDRGTHESRYGAEPGAAPETGHRCGISGIAGP
jgi:RimJ/RimL family protein N-acetyltransferase